MRKSASMKDPFHHIVVPCVHAAVAVVLASCTGSDVPPARRLDSISLPPGFHISIYAENVPDARSLALGPKGTVFVGNRSGDKVFAVVDSDGDYQADGVLTIASGLTMPNGVAVRDGDLYVAEVSRILRFADIENNLRHPPKPEVIYDLYPEDRAHGWKFIRFGPDRKLYVPVGAPCNVCEMQDKRYASITRLDVDFGTVEVFAHGVRNSVGFDWHPLTGTLWFTDNGRDNMGDDIPPDELNRADRSGMHFGFPYVHGRSIMDPEFGKGHSPEEFVPPAMELGPHVAALGMRFYTGSMFPVEYRNQILIAEHGSWNRSTPIGYRISLVQLDEDWTVRYTVFAEGWLQGSKAWGRPVDLQQLPDGSLLVSDDHAGVLYRITYKP
jgi:glucose/arabinose dehydrogenase